MHSARFGLTATAIVFLCCPADAQSVEGEALRWTSLGQHSDIKSKVTVKGRALPGTECFVTVPEGGAKGWASLGQYSDFTSTATAKGRALSGTECFVTVPEGGAKGWASLGQYSDFTSTATAKGTALSGTEYSVTVPEGETAFGLAVRVSETSGVPVSVIRVLAEDRAVLAIDREKLVIEIIEALGRSGVAIELVDSFGEGFMGQKPPPRFRLASIEEIQGTSFADSLQRALSESAGERRPLLLAEAAREIVEVTPIPIQFKDGDIPGSVIVSPVSQGLSTLLKNGVAAIPGVTAEPVAIARPFLAIN